MDVIINVIINKNNMKTIFKTLALGLLLMTVASCEKHDPFDENTITGAVGPEAKWDIASSMIKAGESMEFTGQYYSTVADNFIDHSEVWYEAKLRGRGYSRSKEIVEHLKKKSY